MILTIILIIGILLLLFAGYAIMKQTWYKPYAMTASILYSLIMPHVVHFFELI